MLCNKGACFKKSIIEENLLNYAKKIKLNYFFMIKNISNDKIFLMKALQVRLKFENNIPSCIVRGRLSRFYRCKGSNY